jgi:hypothetical protein
MTLATFHLSAVIPAHTQDVPPPNKGQIPRGNQRLYIRFVCKRRKRTHLAQRARMDPDNYIQPASWFRKLADLPPACTDVPQRTRGQRRPG